MMKIIFNALMVLRGWFNTLACCQLLDSGFNQWLWWRWSRSKCREDDSAFWLVVDYDSDRELLCQRGHRCGQSNSINWLLMSRGGWEWRWLIMVIMTNDDDDDIGSESSPSRSQQRPLKLSWSLATILKMVFVLDFEVFRFCVFCFGSG